MEKEKIMSLPEEVILQHYKDCVVELKNIKQSLDKSLNQWIEFERQQDEQVEGAIPAPPLPSASLKAWVDFLGELEALGKKGKYVAFTIAFAKRMIQDARAKMDELLAETPENTEDEKQIIDDDENYPSPCSRFYLQR